MNTLLRPFAVHHPATPAPPLVRPNVSVIMVVYKTGPILFDSIARVLGETLIDEFIVVDNGSTPEDAARLRQVAEQDGRVVLFQGHGNIGFAKASNSGAAASRGRFLIFLNPDALLEDGCVRALTEAATDQPSPCVVGARVLNPDRTEQPGGRRGEVTPVTALLSFTRLTGKVPGLAKFEIHKEDEPLPPGICEIKAISGACFCMPREDFFRLGGFDGRYFLHVEDIDLCWRARRSGGTVLFQPAAEVVHLGHTSMVSPLWVEFWKGRGLARYFRKRADNPWRTALAWTLGPAIIGVAVMRPLMRKVVPPRR